MFRALSTFRRLSIIVACLVLGVAVSAAPALSTGTPEPTKEVCKTVFIGASAPLTVKLTVGKHTKTIQTSTLAEAELTICVKASADVDIFLSKPGLEDGCLIIEGFVSAEVGVDGSVQVSVVISGKDDLLKPVKYSLETDLLPVAAGTTLPIRLEVCDP